MTVKKDKKEKPGKSGEVELTEEELDEAAGGRTYIDKSGPDYFRSIGDTSPLDKK